MIESDRPLKNLIRSNFAILNIIVVMLALWTSCTNETTPSEENVKTASQPLYGTCSGSIAQACSYYGTTESACNSCSAIDCQWVNGECVPENDCEALNVYQCYLAIYGADPISSCSCTEPPPADESECFGSIATACSIYGTSEQSCNEATQADCQWVNGTCIPETDCTQLNETSCTTVIANTSPIPSCVWRLPNAEETNTCAGSIATACTVNGTTETICNTLPGIDCQWINDTCVPEIDCNALDIYNCYLAGANTNPIESCTWGISAPPTASGTCSGSIAQACSYYGTTESVCNSCSAIDCQWVNNACVPEIDCENLQDEYTCMLAINGSDPIPSCTWTPDP